MNSNNKILTGNFDGTALICSLTAIKHLCHSYGIIDITSYAVHSYIKYVCVYYILISLIILLICVKNIYLQLQETCSIVIVGAVKHGPSTCMYDTVIMHAMSYVMGYCIAPDIYGIIFWTSLYEQFIVGSF